MPTPWTFFCTDENLIPNDIQGAKYALIQKSELCLCSITAGSLYLHENIGSCADKKTQQCQNDFIFHHQSSSLYLYFQELLPDLNLKLDVIFMENGK